MERGVLKWGSLLLLVAFIWGTTFAVMKDLLEGIALSSFLFWRFLMASIILLSVGGRRLFRLTGKQLGQSVFLGLLLFGGYYTQVAGLKYTTASQAAFITGLSVVLVPFLAMFLKQDRLFFRTWVGIFAAAIGLYLLTYTGGLEPGRGELLVLMCTAFFALYIVFVGRYALNNDPVPFVGLQLLLTALLFGLLASLDYSNFVAQTVSLSFSQWLIILYMGMWATALAFLWEHRAQQVVSATFTALALATEPVFGAIFAFFYLGELLPLAGYFGGFLVAAGMYLAGTAEKRGVKYVAG